MSVFYNDRFVRNLYIGVSGAGLFLSIVGYGSDQWQRGITLAELPWALGGVLLQSLHLFLPRPEIFLDPHCPALVRIAALLCGVSGFLAAAMVWVKVANRSVADIWTQVFQRGHVVIVGDGDFANRLTESLVRVRRSVVQAVEAASSDAEVTSYRLRVTLTPEKLRRRTALARSKTVVIDTGSDTDSMAKAAALVADLGVPRQLENIAVRVTDPVLSDRFIDHLNDRYGRLPVAVNVFDENRILARKVLAENLLFRRAAERGQRRVHALIIGFGDLGEKLMDQILLTSLTHDLEPPQVTIVDREAEARRRELCARRPRVLSNFAASEFPDISFIEFDLNRSPCMEELTQDAVKILRKSAEKDPLTMIYVVLPNYGEVVRTSLMLRRLQAQFGVFRAPISYRCRLDEDAQDILAQKASPSYGSESGLLRMSMPEGRLLETLLGTEELDKFAIQFHEAFRATGQASPGADHPWDQLPDTLKRANRRAADHVPAKAHAMGVKLGPGMVVQEADRQTLRDLLGQDDSAPMMQKLARLEHERWRIDRYLDGWAFAPENDDLRRMRNTLVPFDELQSRPEEIKKDISQVRNLVTRLLDG